MLGRTPSSTRTVIGVGALMAAATIFAPPGKSQTVAELDFNTQAAEAVAPCNSIRDAVRKAGCQAQRLHDFSVKSIAESKAAIAKSKANIAEDGRAIEAAKKSRAESDENIAESDAKIAEHKQATAGAIAQGQCARDLTSAILGGRVTREEVLSAKTAPPETSDLCEVKRRLHPRLGELSKQ